MGFGSPWQNGSQIFFLLLFVLLLLRSVAFAQIIGTSANATSLNTTAPPALNVTALNTTALNSTALNITSGNATLYNELLDTCKGVVIRYSLDPLIEKIFPISKINKTQPYKFESTVDLVNAGYTELDGWELFIGFQYHEVIADAGGISFTDGSQPPGLLAENGSTVIGVNTPDLLTSIDTAEDLTLIAATFSLVGTEFGVGPGQPIHYPLPHNLTLVNPGYSCNKPIIDENFTMLVCCPENSSAVGKLVPYLPRYTGDITMYYDVTQTQDDYYEAQVTINMDDPIGSLTHWNLTWDWMHGEFIYSMKGAQTTEQDQDICVDGPAGIQYTGLDFSQAMSCQKTPTIVDLSADRMADQQLPGCCRNGTLLPPVLDPSQSKSVFQLQVYKLSPDLQRLFVDPPANWRIGNIMSGASPYVCGNPREVSPSEFFSNGLHYNSAVRSWQVTCNQTSIPRTSPHKCCVSFSGYYNNSVVPCPTCACGCQTATMAPGNMVCDANPNVEAMLLPAYALLLPPSNRTILASTLAKLEHYPQPNPMPCPDNCGLSINWHIYSDYTNGFSARMTLFNWNPTAVEPWYTVVQMAKATPGFQNVYSFNGSKITGVQDDANTTLIFMHGKQGYNDELLGLEQGPDVPGKLQSLLSFDKRKTPGIDVVGGDGFPSRVWFNGDECEIPDIFPTSSAWRTIHNYPLMIVTLVFALMGPLRVL